MNTVSSIAKPEQSWTEGATDPKGGSPRTAKHKVATPPDWIRGDDVIISGTLSDEEAKGFPGYRTNQTVPAYNKAAQVNILVLD